MTVTYTLSVAESRLAGFPRLLLKWKGSIYKLLYREMTIFIAVFYSIHIIYHHYLNEEQKKFFDKLSDYCDAYTNFIPLSFVLGFYVTMVVGRWWQQWLAIPWPDKLAMLVSSFISGTDERAKTIRLTLIRYINAMQCLTFQAISTSIRKRFPSESDLVDSGIMTVEELEAYKSVEGSHGRWWVPSQWFTALTMEAYREGRIKHEVFLREILNEMHTIRGLCGTLFAYDWVSIPLVYTQTVTIAVYTYFGAKLIGRQYTDKNLADDPDRNFHFYIPFFTIAEFFFFMGWLKVAEQLINPFGEDDDDYDCNWILDRNILVSYLLIDDLHETHPEIVSSAYISRPEILLPQPELPLPRKASINPHSGSTMNLNIKQRRPSRLSPFNSVTLLNFPSDDKLSSYYGADLNWQHRAMSVCVPSGNIMQFQETNKARSDKPRKLSLEEGRSNVTKPVIPTVTLQTHVEEENEENSIQDDESTINNNQLIIKSNESDETRKLLSPTTVEILNPILRDPLIL